MTVKVHVRLLSTDPEAHKTHLAANMKALAVASALRDKYVDAQCEHHENPESMVTVVATPHGEVELDKSTLCCDGFREKIAMF